MRCNLEALLYSIPILIIDVVMIIYFIIYAIYFNLKIPKILIPNQSTLSLLEDGKIKVNNNEVTVLKMKCLKKYIWITLRMDYQEKIVIFSKNNLNLNQIEELNKLQDTLYNKNKLDKASYVFIYLLCLVAIIVCMLNIHHTTTWSGVEHMDQSKSSVLMKELNKENLFHSYSYTYNDYFYRKEKYPLLGLNMSEALMLTVSIQREQFDDCTKNIQEEIKLDPTAFYRKNGYEFYLNSHQTFDYFCMGAFNKDKNQIVLFSFRDILNRKKDMIVDNFPLFLEITFNFKIN